MDYLHLKSPGNWINDPNGFIYFGGKYHIFYQHFPYEPVWGTMHWGHAVSSDLINWEHKGIAVYPSKEFDRNGVFSGNAIVIDDKLYLYYTGIKYPNPNPENIHVTADYLLEACQALIISEDGENFDNYGSKRMVIAPSDNDEEMSRSDTRDPKVWKSEADGKYKMILGSTNGGMGRIIFMESEDALSWKQISSFEDPGFGGVFECPDLFRIDDKWILFCAATDLLTDGKTFQAQEIYKIVDFDEITCNLSWDKESFFLDYGTDLYATQTNMDEYGNRVFIAWMRMPEAMDYAEGEVATVIGADKFNGMMTMPRVMELKNNHLYFRPHPNVEKQFVKPMNPAEIEGLEYSGVEALKIFGCKTEESASSGSSAYKISVDLKDQAKIDISGYIIEYNNGVVLTDRTAVYPVGNHRYICQTPVLTEGNHIDIYVDSHIIEIYANNGEYALSNIIY